MPRQQSRVMEELLPAKIRKRGCSSSASSSSSSSSSVIQKYRFKRAILVGKRGRSSTPVPAWKLMGTMTSQSQTPSSALRVVDSPRSQNGNRAKQQPVSARKLAATLWEMNEMPSPKMKETEERRVRKEPRASERGSAASRSFPPHLSDPSHSPVSERMHQSGTGSRHRRTPSISERLMLMDHNVGAFDSVSNASLMEVDARSRVQTPTGSTVGVATRLKDVSNALTTSKELLKIINRVWGNGDRPSSSLSLISALHAELERARLQVNHVIQEQHSDQKEINYLMKCFAEEKAAWKNKEQKVVEAAIESIAGELEIEKKLRRRLESFNKKLGKELSETKALQIQTMKELESEKKARAMMEQVYEEFARDIGEDKAEVEEIKRESAKLCEEVEKEREMMHLADVLREERVHMKLSEAKYQLEEKNAAVDKLRDQLEAFLVPKRTKDKGRSSFSQMNDDEVANYLSKTRFVSHQNELNEDDGEVDDGIDECEDSFESDLHSIELNMDSNNKNYKWVCSVGTPRDSRMAALGEEETSGRKSTSSKAPRRSTSLQRSISDVVEWTSQNERVPISGDGIDWGRLSKLEQQALAKDYGDELHGYQSVKFLRDYLMSGARLESPRGYASPARQLQQPRPSRDPIHASLGRPPVVSGNVSKSRVAEARRENLNARRSRQ